MRDAVQGCRIITDAHVRLTGTGVPDVRQTLQMLS